MATPTQTYSGLFPPASGFPVSGVVAKAAAFTISDPKGALYDLTGSFAITLPPASGGTAAAPLYYHVRKRDGGGACTLVPAGADGWDDGTAAPKAVYQESCTLFAVGTGKWYFAPGTRHRGWVPLGSTTISAAAAAVAFTLGFGDPELRDMVIDGQAVGLSASDSLAMRVAKAGAYQTSGYAAQYSGLSGATASSSSQQTTYILSQALGSSAGICTDLTVSALGTAVQRLASTTFTSSPVSFGAVQAVQTGTAGTITGVQFYPLNGSNIVAGTFTQKAFRP